MSVLTLQKSVIYGPVRSRRLGSSLGVNLLPSDSKFCSYNCVYCQYGWTRRHALALEEEGALPSTAQVERAVERALRRGDPIDYVTLAGNGEPTVHPEFADIVDVVRSLRDRLAPGVRTAILSNSSTLGRPEIREALSRLDDPIMKLDVGTEVGWRRFNRPCPGVEWTDMISGLEALDRPVVQSLFAEGGNSNTGQEEVAAWAEHLGRIQPRMVQVYTLDRPTADGGLRPVDRPKLEEIAKQAKDGAGVAVRVF